MRIRSLVSFLLFFFLSFEAFAQNCPTVVAQTPQSVEVQTRVRFSINLPQADWIITGPQGTLTFQGTQFDSVFTKPGNYHGVVAGADACEQIHRIEFDFVVYPKISANSIVINNNAAYTNTSLVNLQLDATGATEMLLSSDSSCTGAWQSYANQTPYLLAQSNATATVYVKFRNPFKETNCISDSIIHDDVAPVAQITSAPANWVGPFASSFTFTSSDNFSGVAQVFCTLDGNLLAACASPMNLGSLSQGPHQFQLQAVDFAGNYSTAITAKWNVDITPPSISITSKPSNPSQEVAPSFAFKAVDAETGVVSYECSLDQQAFVACQSPLSFKNLSEGPHRFEVRAVNSVNLVSVPATYNWTIALPQPVAKSLVINSNDVYTTNTQVTLGLQATDATEMLISDSATCTGAWQAYSNSTSWTLKNKNADVKVYAKFRNQFKESTCISDSIIHDDVAPVVTITSAPQGWVSVNTARISYQQSDNLSGVASVSCKLDGGAVSNCQSPLNLANLLQGAHRFEISATDKAGNVGSIVVAEWSVDVTAPVVTLTSVPQNPSDALVQRFAFTAVDSETGVANLNCEVDGKSISPCVSPLEIPDLFEGTHTFQVRATNAVGLIGAASYTWNIEFPQPTVSITKAPPAKTYIVDAQFEFVGQSIVGIKSYECRMDSGSVTACTSPKLYSMLSLGQHEFSVRAIDSKGRISDWESYQWLIEKAPIQTIVEKIISAGPSYKADVLMVFDNSFSMNDERKELKYNMTGFMNLLGSADWQLAVTSTDPKGDKIWEEGRLGLIQNPQTVDAEKTLIRTLEKMPEGTYHEEGIESAYLAIHRTENQSFFRDDAALILLIISDEDEKSRGTKLEPVNQPENLVKAVQDKWGRSKSFVAHTVVDQSGKKHCENADHQGNTYSRLSEITGGIKANICGKPYVTQLAGFMNALPGSNLVYQLACLPIGGKIDVQPANLNVTLKADMLTISPAPPKGSTITVKYDCATRLSQALL